MENELETVKQAVQEAGEAIVRIAEERYQTAAEQA